MIATTFNGATAYVLNHEPDWRDRVSLKASVPARIERGLTGRETRRPVADALRCELSWSALLDRAAANALRLALQVIATEPILCPAWPFAAEGDRWTGEAVSGGLLIGWLNDWSDFEVGATLDDAAEWDWVAPCLVGRLDSAPEPHIESPEVCTVAFRFVEDAAADYALAPAAVSWTAGPALSDAITPPVFPFAVTWHGRQSSGAAELEIERTQLGESRQTAATAYPQTPERLIAADLLLTRGSDIAALLRWLEDFASAAQFVAELGLVCGLDADAAIGAESLTLDDVSAIGDNRLLQLSDGIIEELVLVESVAGAVCALSAPLTYAWPAGDSAVRLATLARLAKPEFTLEFTSPEVAAVRLAWREVPAELSPDEGEDRGDTLGVINTHAWLYLVKLDWDGDTETHRFTGFERDLTASGQVWTSRPAEHGELRQSLALDRDELSLRVRWWAGCPFRKLLPNALDCRITLAIYDCRVSGSTGTAVAQWFGGEITGLQAEGPMLTLSAAGANALFDRRCPRLLLQTSCNHALFDAGCGLDRADWTFTAEVYSVSGTSLVLENFARTGGLPAGFGFAHWFALGWLEATIDGDLVRTMIFDSGALDEDERIALTLASPFTTAPEVGDSITLFPGCDNRPETCAVFADPGNPTGKFDNYARFGGFPFVPTSNPGFTPMKQTDSNLSKK